MATGAEIIGVGKLVDLILDETFGEAIRTVMKRRARIAREEIVRQVRKGKLWMITDDDAAAAIFTYVRAAQEGAARLNLRMMAGALFTAAQEPTFAPDEFRRQANALADLSRDEVLLLAAFIRAERAAPTPSPGDPNSARRTSDLVWAMILADPRGFQAGFDVLAVAGALTRTGWVIPVSSVGQLNYFTTSAFDGVTRLVDFEVVQMELQASD